MSILAHNKKVIIAIIAYKAEKTLEKTYRAIPLEWVDEVILGDDGSPDNTVEISRKLGIKTLVHEKNKGYGENQKMCYREALKDGGDIIVMLHGDFQYDPSCIPEMVKPIAEGRADVTFGSRMLLKDGALKGGMPLWKFIPNKVLTYIEDSVYGLGLSEYHTGYRAYSRKVLTTIPFEQNARDFAFDAEVFPQLKIGGFRVAEVAIPTRYFAEASSPNLKASTVYGLQVLSVATKYLLHRLGLKKYSIFIMKQQHDTK